MTPREKSLERFKKNSQTEQEIDKGIQEDKQAEDDAEVLKRKLEQAQRALELAKKENANYKSAINEEEVGKIVSDVDDELFIKTYHYRAGKEDKSVRIVLRPAMAYDQSVMAQRVVDITDGKGVYMDANNTELITAVALFQTVGKGLPDTLTDLHKISRTDLVFEIFEDYNEWLDNFRNKQIL